MKFTSKICVLLLGAFAGSGLLAACGEDNTSSSDAGADGAPGAADANIPDAGPSGICTPGAYVFCRCSNGDDGTKPCNSSGTGFGACALGRDSGSCE
jgi:hypothetical protein